MSKGLSEGRHECVPERASTAGSHLWGPLDEKIDIWLVFRLLFFKTLARTTLFDRPMERFRPDVCALLSDVDAFPPYLRGGVYAEKYLDLDGVISEPELRKQLHGICRMLDGRRPGLDPAAEGDTIAAILQRCLKLDPRERPSADSDQLLEDPSRWADVNA